MSADPKRSGRFADTTVSSPVAAKLPPRRRIAELDRVTVGLDVVGDDGETVPSGATGTVVAIWADGAAFEVEFTDPVSALATVDAAAITTHTPR